MASSLIGKYVTAESNDIRVETAGDERLGFKLAGAATEISVDIRDQDGVVVRTLTMSPQAAGQHSISWDGLNSDGKRVPEGHYTFEVRAIAGDGSAVAATTLVQGIVDSVRYEDGNVLLQINDLDIRLGQVLSLANSGGKG
jgi:flagellar basal-body rod modification protein FlgD